MVSLARGQAMHEGILALGQSGKVSPKSWSPELDPHHSQVDPSELFGAPGNLSWRPL